MYATEFVHNKIFAFWDSLYKHFGDSSGNKLHKQILICFQFQRVNATLKILYNCFCFNSLTNKWNIWVAFVNIVTLTLPDEAAAQMTRLQI